MPFKIFKKYQIVKRNKAVKKLAIASVVSGVVGALFTAFTSPRSGSENRKAVIKSSYKLGEKAKENLDKALEETREGSKHVADKAVETAKGVRGRLEDFVSSLKSEKNAAEIEAKVESKAKSIEETIKEKSDEGASKLKAATAEARSDKK